MSFKQILLALDRTENADRVFDQGVAIAKKYNACLTLAHCVHDTPILPETFGAGAGGGLPWPGAALGGTTPISPNPATPRDYLQRQVEVTRDWLRQYQQRAYDAGSEDAMQAIPVGSPGDSLCDLAAEIGADLIVVGRKNRSGLEELMLGSVSSKVVHHAPCAVLVVKTE